MKIVIPTLEGKLCAHFGHCETFSFAEVNPETKEILSRFLFLENQKIVNLSYLTNTDLKYKYGVANLNLLTEYDTNYSELITLLQNYGNMLLESGFEEQALTVLEYSISIGSDISKTYTTCAAIYQNHNQTRTEVHQKGRQPY